MSIKVKLRQKSISGNKLSLYLDFYPPIINPKSGALTRREFLGMYLYEKVKNPVDKQHNKETFQLADQIRQKRENYLNKPEIYTGYEREQIKIREKGEKDFVLYFKSLANKRKASNFDNWISSFKYLEQFTGGSLTFLELDEKFCNDFKDYLLTAKSNKGKKLPLSQNSALSYFNKFKATLKQAYKDGYLNKDLNGLISPIKEVETQRSFLTIEELNKLNKTEYPRPVLRRAAMFFALTGVRFCDLKIMKWSDIEFIKGQGYYYKFRQEKTGGVEMMPINDQAYSFLGEAGMSTDLVFNGLKDKDRYYHFPKWVAMAEITKDITFHCMRHTFATLQLTNGTDIYTVSKMLGHRNLKTTQVYAKIVDQKKREAANRITLDL